MKTIPLLFSAFFAAISVLSADSVSLSYTQANAAYQAMLAPANPPWPDTPDTHAARAKSLQAVVAALDITPTQKAAALDQLGHEQRFSLAAPAVYLDSYWQAYQLGLPGAFMDFLGYSIEAGEPFAANAVQKVPAFATVFPDPDNAAQAQARVAEYKGDFAQAFLMWKAVADAHDTYVLARGYAIAAAAKAAHKKGDTQAQVNEFLMSYLTAYNVGFVDSNFQVAYDLVNRSPKVQPVTTTADFLITLLTIIDPTEGNAAFLGKIQSQLNLLPKQ